MSAAAILRMSIALGVCAAVITLLVWRQPIMEMANGRTATYKVLCAVWFILGWGVATGALTGLAVSSARRRSSGRLSAAVALVVALLLTSTVCLVLYRYFTDAKFMQDATSGLPPYSIPGVDMDIRPGMDMDLHPTHTQPSRPNVVGVLTPNFIAVAISVIYAFGGKRRGTRLSE